MCSSVGTLSHTLTATGLGDETGVDVFELRYYVGVTRFERKTNGLDGVG